MKVLYLARIKAMKSAKLTGAHGNNNGGPVDVVAWMHPHAAHNNVIDTDAEGVCFVANALVVAVIGLVNDVVRADRQQTSRRLAVCRDAGTDHAG